MSFKLKLPDPETMRGMTRVERDFTYRLEALRHDGEIIWWLFEAVKLNIGTRCWYTPDFCAIKAATGILLPGAEAGGLGELIFYECKGSKTFRGKKPGGMFWHEDARVKIKAAARRYPYFQFVAVTKGRGGIWHTEEIKP